MRSRVEVLPGLALALLASFQPLLEQSMALHMVVELPLLFAIGWWCRASTRLGARFLSSIDPTGIASFTATALILAFWMIPIALDDAVLHVPMGIAKVATLVAAGLLANYAFGVTRTALQGFFVMNWAWMTAVTGLLYQQVPERLCNTYLQGDQSRAGMGLVALAIGGTALWLFATFRIVDAPDGREPIGPVSASRDAHDFGVRDRPGPLRAGSRRRRWAHRDEQHCPEQFDDGAVAAVDPNSVRRASGCTATCRSRPL